MLLVFTRVLRRDPQKRTLVAFLPLRFTPYILPRYVLESWSNTKTRGSFRVAWEKEMTLHLVAFADQSDVCLVSQGR